MTAPESTEFQRIDLQRTRPIPGDYLANPVAIIALGIVIFNDRYLKVHHPGVVSGKLSDFAGLIYFPLFLASLIEVVRWAARHKPWMIPPRVVDVLPSPIVANAPGSDLRGAVTAAGS